VAWVTGTSESSVERGASVRERSSNVDLDGFVVRQHFHA
jgi:hypothetical protein